MQWLLLGSPCDGMDVRCMDAFILTPDWIRRRPTLLFAAILLVNYLDYRGLHWLHMNRNKVRLLLLNKLFRRCFSLHQYVFNFYSLLVECISFRCQLCIRLWPFRPLLWLSPFFFNVLRRLFRVLLIGQSTFMRRLFLDFIKLYCICRCFIVAVISLNYLIKVISTWKLIWFS